MFKGGQVITNGNVERLILEKRDTGYTWCYPESEETFLSENSNDPLFERGWRVKNQRK